MAGLPILAKLEAELAELDREYRVTLPRLIREAAAQGDLSDNAEGARVVVQETCYGKLSPARNPVGLAETVCEVLQNPGAYAPVARRSERYSAGSDRSTSTSA